MHRLPTRRGVLASGAAFAGLAAVPALRAQSPIVVKSSHVEAPETPKGTGADRFRGVPRLADRDNAPGAIPQAMAFSEPPRPMAHREIASRVGRETIQAVYPAAGFAVPR